MEVIVCLGVEKDRHGQHRHSDPCFEVRTLSAPFVTDLLSGEAIDLRDHMLPKPAPEILLQRKAMYFRRMAKRVRDREEMRGDRYSDAQHAHLLILEVDRYSMVDPTTLLRAAAPQSAEEKARDARARELFDEAAPLLTAFKKASTTSRPWESAGVDGFFQAYIDSFGPEHLRRT